MESSNGLTPVPPPALVESLVDSISAKMKRHVPLDAVVNELALYYSDPVQRAALDAAANQIRKSVADIERLRHPTTLKAPERKAWYAGPRDTDDFWPALKRYLEKKRGDEVVKAIDRGSTKVVSCLDFPGSASFSSRGLVVGYVQSGKTANFTAVISKAADAGYRLFLVLSGLTNSLRRQTQDRLDAELVRLQPKLWQTWTDLQSDIGDYPFNIDAMLHGQQRHLAVVKKNGPRLRRLLRMIKKADPQLLKQCPVLIIDDECDQASVNASGNQDRLTVINRLLRDFLETLPRVAYVGYTATPYANVLIDPSYEQDLYPRDFIVSLDMPDGYFGAEKLFGRDLLDADPVPPNESGLDMIRTIPNEDIEYLRPANRDQKDTFVISVTSTLGAAIRYFVMATAAKSVRGLGSEHSCMLIHTTVYARAHANAKPVVEAYVQSLEDSIKRGDPSVLEELRTQWEEEMGRLPSETLGRETVTFDELLPHLLSAENKPSAVVENSLSDQRLEFGSDPRRYIVIGGNVLARGLTIDGLVVSFFLRAASQYDTLMQMGRWFGYRRGYEDLPRIWMTRDMAQYFKDMATVEAEIRYDIEVYERERLTPLQFAIRIREHPDLAITAKNKMGAAVDCHVSFAGRHFQTRRFKHASAQWLADNWDAAELLLDRIAKRRIPGRGSAIAFGEVPFTEIVAFLREYELHPSHQSFATSKLIEYIAEQNGKEPGSLALWNVAVVVTSDGAESDRPLGALGQVSMVSRARLRIDGDADIKALMSRQDVLADLPNIDLPGKAGWAEVKEIRQKAFKAPRPLLLLYPINRNSRAAPSSTDRIDMNAAHDLIGIAVVFPTPKNPVPLGYKRAAIDSYVDEEPEYDEERLPDDVVTT